MRVLHTSLYNSSKRRISLGILLLFSPIDYTHVTPVDMETDPFEMERSRFTARIPLKKKIPGLQTATSFKSY
jgi:hypothetical protein